VLFEGTAEAVEVADSAEQTATRVATLSRRYEAASTGALLRGMLGREFPGQIALVSSFGIESAVILSLVAEIDPATPVIFLDTGKHFPQTLAYRDTLIERLGLTDVRSIAPDPALAAAVDPDGRLSQRAPDHCCFLRKVEPLDRALDGFAAWITGRKRFQGGERQALPRLEEVDGRIKINPLVDWTPQDVASAFRTRDLPLHPLALDGYRSVGCAPCTQRTAPGQDARAGRWAGLAKTECGIHSPRRAAA
jgi:phosphoadenosine phosphosulfate reductase